jgi:metal-responsive CopG/Arc/MetJ family transcriptional regulator
MEIMSVSVDRETLDELSEIQENLGFKSRSKMLRSMIDLLLSEYRVIDSLKGQHEIVFVITYRDRESNHVSSLMHEFKDDIKVNVHQHRGTMCTDMINVEADAGVIRRLFKEIKNSKCIRSVNFALLGHY